MDATFKLVAQPCFYAMLRDIEEEENEQAPEELDRWNTWNVELDRYFDLQDETRYE